MNETATPAPAREARRPAIGPEVLDRVAGELRCLLAGLEVEAVPVADAPAWWRRFDEVDRLASAAKLLLARRVDQSDVAERAGLRSTTEWFAATAGGSVRSGQDLLATSKRLADLPQVEAAVRDGSLSLSQAGPIAHAAEADPEAQSDLVGAARVCSLRELLVRCAKVRAAADPDPEGTAERIRKARRLRSTRDQDGAFSLYGRGPIEDGAELETVLATITDEIFREGHTRGAHDPHEAYRWDALIETARRAWAHMHRPDQADNPADRTDASGRGPRADERTGPADRPATGAHGDDPGGGFAAGEPEASTSAVAGSTAVSGTQATSLVGPPRRRKRRPGVNAWSRAVLRVDYEPLIRGRIDGDETCDIAGVGPVPVSVARRLLGTSTLHLVVTRGGAVRNVIYLGRGPNAAQRIALLWEQPECSRLGCPRPARETDHRDD